MSGAQSKVRIALFGESDNGKSHFGAQLLERIEAEKCEIKLQVAAADVSAFDEVRRRLGAGLLAEHTPSGVYQDVILPYWQTLLKVQKRLGGMGSRTD